MKDDDQDAGIFAGTNAITADFFGLTKNQHLTQRSISRGLNDPGLGDQGFTALFSNLYNCIRSNYSGLR